MVGRSEELLASFSACRFRHVCFTPDMAILSTKRAVVPRQNVPRWRRVTCTMTYFYEQLCYVPSPKLFNLRASWTGAPLEGVSTVFHTVSRVISDPQFDHVVGIRRCRERRVRHAVISPQAWSGITATLQPGRGSL